MTCKNSSFPFPKLIRTLTIGVTTIKTARRENMVTKDTLINSFNEINFKELRMPIICIYFSPSDYKEMYVARVFDVDQPLPLIMMRNSLEALRKEIPEQFNVIPRSPNDDNTIVESWM
jgi:hypothetical protein